MSNKPYQLLIFDWDGTLMDSAGHIVAAFQKAIIELDLPARDDRSIRELIGLGLDVAMARLYPELETDYVMKLLDAYRRGFVAASPAQSTLFAGVQDSLLVLREEQYRLAVATGKSRAGLERELQSSELAAFFEASRCADETRSKPDPLMLEELLWETGLEAEQALMIGDTEYDIAMAKRIGMPALAVDCGVHERDRLLQAGALDLIADVAQLPLWLASREVV